MASVFSDVTVPAFDSAALSLSGVTVDVASTSSGAPVPTTRRVFNSGERVRASVQIYQGTSRTDAPAPVVMQVQVLDAKGRSVHEESLPFSATTFTDRRADCVMAIPLANLSPGEYLLKLEASAERGAIRARPALCHRVARAALPPRSSEPGNSSVAPRTWS